VLTRTPCWFTASRGQRRESRPLSCRRGTPLRLPVIPAALWQLPSIRTALSKDDIGGVLEGYRKALNLSQAEFANLLSDDILNFSQATVSRIEAGALVKDIDDRRRISEVLGIPPEMLGLASRASFSRASLALRPSVSVVVRTEGVTGSVRRRTLLTGAAALVGWTLAGPPGQTLERKVGMAHVKQAEAALNQVWALDDRYGGNGIQELAVSLFQRIQAMLNHSIYDEPTGVRLHALTGRLAEHAGWLSFDAGLQDHARYYLTEAMTAARLTDDEELEVLVLGSMSAQSAQVGRHREAVALAARAQESPVARRTPSVYAMAAFREARAHALARDAVAASKAMLRAEKAFYRAGNRPGWVAYLDEAELAAKLAFCWLALGAADKAVPLFAQALDAQQADYQRNRALYSAYLAKAHLAGGDVEQASAVGLVALDNAEQVTSARVGKEMTSLRQQLARHRELPAAREYVEQYESRLAHLDARSENRL
jgi:transcriptional regulator with XRE-family HTH domain